MALLAQCSRCPRPFLLILQSYPWRNTHPATVHSEAAWGRHFSSAQDARHILPRQSWDSHMHIVEPERYPLSSSAQYKPSPHTMSQAVTALSTLGIQNMVLVQPSVYGTDNSCLLDGLRTLTPQHGRGVVEVDPGNISQKELHEWHDLGVRGIRVNLKSRGSTEMPGAEFASLLRRYADIARPFDWILELWVSLSMVPLLYRVLPSLDIRVCLDHFGGPPTLPPSASPSSSVRSTLDPYSLVGFPEFIRLLEDGSTYVKLSAAYRFSLMKDAEGEAKDLRPLAVEILRRAGNRVVYGTDWPHTRYEGLTDAQGLQDATLRWCYAVDTSGLLAEEVFRTNAEDLWGVTA